MAAPVIGYRNILRNTGAILTASSTETGFAVADLKDHRAFKIWKSGVTTSPITVDIDLGVSGSVDADYIALVNHNGVANGATYKLYGDTVTPPTNVVVGAYSPVSDAVEYKPFTAPGAKRYWRLEIAKASPPFPAKPFIGEFLLGLRITMPEFLDPSVDPFTRQVEVASQRSEGGHYLGALLRGVRRRAQLTFGDAGIARSFYTSDLNAFIQTHALKRLPFVFVLDSADTDFDDAMWLKVPDESEIGRLAVGGSYGRFALTLPVEEALVEAA